jgi:hypothetical protein
MNTHNRQPIFNISIVAFCFSVLTGCTFIKNDSKPSADVPTATAEPAADFRCKGANTEYWNDAANTKINYTLCRANLGLIDAGSVESARKDSPSQAVLVFLGSIAKSKKQPSDELFIDDCAKNRGESLIMVRMSAGLKDEIVFCRFPDGSILEGRTLFFGSLAPGYTELSGLLD